MRLILQEDERAQVERSCGKHLDWKQRYIQVAEMENIENQKMRHCDVTSTNYISKTNLSGGFYSFFSFLLFIWVCIHTFTVA